MTLKIGDKGHHVMLLQSALVAYGIPLPKYGVDGIYGPETQAAVKQAQQKLGLALTGVADQHLLTKLGLSPKTTSTAPVVASTKPAGKQLWILAGVVALAAAIAIKKARSK